MTTSRLGSSLSISTFHISSDEEDDEDEEEETSARAFSRYSSLNLAMASFSAGVNAETSGDDDDDDIVRQRELCKVGQTEEREVVCERGALDSATSDYHTMLLWQRALNLRMSDRGDAAVVFAHCSTYLMGNGDE